MLKLRQYFCKHDYKIIAQHESTQSHLWKCKKCKVYFVQHFGIDVGYKCKIPNIGGWGKVKM
ncbi:hypothetical protein CN981_08525 [Priestia megaterium]|nr:hypothetical protein CN981_08525 [Priestia megaterium]